MSHTTRKSLPAPARSPRATLPPPHAELHLRIHLSRVELRDAFAALDREAEALLAHNAAGQQAPLDRVNGR